MPSDLDDNIEIIKARVRLKRSRTLLYRAAQEYAEALGAFDSTARKVARRKKKRHG